MPSYIALIPARGGSKGIPGKNIHPIGGKPLIAWAIEAAASCPEILEVFVATDDAKIRREVNALNLPGVSVVDRSPETATDHASTESVVLEFLDRPLPFSATQNLVLIQATSPLITSDDLSRAIALLEARGADSLVSVCRQKRFLWQEKDGFATPVNYDPMLRPRRQEFPGFLVENGAFYIASSEGIRRSRCRLHGKVVAFEMGPETYLEIDDPEDLLLVEQILLQREGLEGRKKRNQEMAERIRGISLVLLDVDGVLTDGGMYYGNDGEILKKFNTRDGMGIGRLQDAGIEVILVTGENSPVVSARAKKLGINEVHLGIDDKLTRVEAIRHERGLSWEALAYMGDDLNDIEVLRRVGFAATVADARPEIRAIAHYTAEARGGQGAVRELSDMILSGTPLRKGSGGGSAVRESTLKRYPSSPISSTQGTLTDATK